MRSDEWVVATLYKMRPARGNQSTENHFHPGWESDESEWSRVHHFLWLFWSLLPTERLGYDKRHQAYPTPFIFEHGSCIFCSDPPSRKGSTDNRFDRRIGGWVYIIQDRILWSWIAIRFNCCELWKRDRWLWFGSGDHPVVIEGTFDSFLIIMRYLSSSGQSVGSYSWPKCGSANSKSIDQDTVLLKKRYVGMDLI